MFAFAFLVLALLALTIGLGYLFGAGVGWIVFALLCLVAFYRALKTLGEKAKEEGKKE